MPKLIDYSVRFELIREAVVRVAAREGGRAVDLTRIASELQISTSTLRRTLRSPDVLPETGVVLVARLRQYERFRHNRPRAAPEPVLAHVRRLLWTELPRDDAKIEWARAWAELTVIGAGGRIETLRREHDEWLDLLVAGAIERLAVPVERREREAIRLRALVDGVTMAVCAGRITTDQLETCIDAHLHEISRVPEGATV